MSDKRDAGEPGGKVKPEGEGVPHKVDEAVQEDAAKERAENEGYD